MSWSIMLKITKRREKQTQISKLKIAKLMSSKNGLNQLFRKDFNEEILILNDSKSFKSRNESNKLRLSTNLSFIIVYAQNSKSPCETLSIRKKWFETCPIS